MDNLKEFDRIATIIFTDCYNNFPIPVSFSFSSFYDDAATKEREALVNNTFMWLQQYGYITKSRTVGGNMIAYDVQLTEKALSVLSWVPSSLFTPKASLGQRLTVLVKSGSKEGASELLRQIIQFSFASMTNLFR